MKKLIVLLIALLSFSFAVDYVGVNSGSARGKFSKTSNPTLAGVVVPATVKIAGTAVTSTNAIISATDSVIIVTPADADANSFVVLPTPVVGHKITIIADQVTGNEIRPALETQYINGTLCSSGKELLVPSGSVMECIAVVAGSAGKWIITQKDNDGTWDAGGTPD